MTSSAGATYRLSSPAELQPVRSVHLARRFLTGQNHLGRSGRFQGGSLAITAVLQFAAIRRHVLLGEILPGEKARARWTDSRTGLKLRLAERVCKFAPRNRHTQLAWGVIAASLETACPCAESKQTLDGTGWIEQAYGECVCGSRIGSCDKGDEAPTTAAVHADVPRTDQIVNLTGR